MVDINEAARAAKKLTRQFKDLLTINQFLEEFGNLEQAQNEARSRVNALRLVEEEVAAGLDLARDELKRVLCDRDAVEGYCESARTKADTDADSIREEARVDAERIKDEADRETTKLFEANTVAQDSHDSFMASALADEEKLTVRIGELKREIADIKARL